MYKIILITLLAFFFLGCSEEKPKTLTVAISPWPGYEPLAFALEKGFYRDLDVRIVRFSTPRESFRALRDGVVDVAAFTADEVLHYAQMQNKPKMFLILDVSNGGDAIVAKKSIKSLEDLKGKNVYIEPSALGDYVINRAMDFTESLTTDNFKISTAEISHHLELYKSGKADAIVTYEPFRSLLLKEGAHEIFNSKQMPNEIIDVLVTEDDTLQEKSAELKKLADSWFKTIEYIKNNKQEAMKTMASYENISVEAFENSYNNLIVPSKEANIKMLSFGEDSYINSLNRLSKLMLKKGSIDKKVDTSELLTHKILEVSK